MCLPASAEEDRQGVKDEHATGQPHNSKPEATDDIRSNDISSPGTSAASEAIAASAASSNPQTSAASAATATGAVRTVKELISAAAPADLSRAAPAQSIPEDCPRAFFSSIRASVGVESHHTNLMNKITVGVATRPLKQEGSTVGVATRPLEQTTKEAQVLGLPSCSKNKIYRTVKNEPNHISLNTLEDGSDRSLSESDEMPEIKNLKAGRDRICQVDTPVQEHIEESPVVMTGSSFGLAADEGDEPSASQSRRMRALNRENGRMRDLLDSVQEKVQKIWDDGLRVKISIEAVERRRKAATAADRGCASIQQQPGADTVSGSTQLSYAATCHNDEEEPLSIDVVDTSKPLAVGDGMDAGGDGEWVRIKNGIGMDTCCAANVMPTTWLPQFEVEPGKSKQRYIGATGKVVENKGQKLLKWFTNEGQGRSMMFQMTDVNKILACIAEVCDGGNDVLFRKNGGMIIPQGDMKLDLKVDGNITNFNRTGNTYSMDAWVKRGKSRSKPQTKPPRSTAMDVDATSGFTRPGVAA